MPKGMGMLTKLCTLSTFIVSEEDGCSLKELKNLNELGGSFCISGLEYASCDDAREAAMQDKKHLTRLHMKWNDSISYDMSARQNATSIVNTLQPNSALEELQISYFPGDALPDWMRSVYYDQLVSVTLQRCENLTFVAPSSLAKLKYLNIIDMNGVVQIVPDAHEKQFPSLETLTIDGMCKLQAWTGVKSSNKDLPCLWKLCLRHCPKLTHLHFLPLLCSLKYLEISHCKSFESLPYDSLPASLETLIINQCPLSRSRCSKQGQDWEKIKHVPNIWIDMKGVGSANEDIDSDYPDDSDEDLDYSDDDSDEIITP